MPKIRMATLALGMQMKTNNTVETSTTTHSLLLLLALSVVEVLVWMQTPLLQTLPVTPASGITSIQSPVVDMMMRISRLATCAVPARTEMPQPA